MPETRDVRRVRTKEERQARRAERHAERVAKLSTRTRVKKVFQIGFNKCGTRSITRFFEKNGLPAIHWQGGRPALRIQSNVEAGRPALEGLPEVVLYSDLEGPKRHPTVLEAFKLFDRIYEADPSAYFILNTRNIDHWITSRMNHGGGSYAQRYLQLLGLSSLLDLERHWREDWLTHHERVISFFSDKKDQLLVFDIERQNGTDLTAFLRREFRLKPEHYGHKGRTKSKAEQSEADDED